MSHLEIIRIALLLVLFVLSAVNGRFAVNSTKKNWQGFLLVAFFVSAVVLTEIIDQLKS